MSSLGWDEALERAWDENDRDMLEEADEAEREEEETHFDCLPCADGEGLPEGRSCGYCGLDKGDETV